MIINVFILREGYSYKKSINDFGVVVCCATVARLKSAKMALTFTFLEAWKQDLMFLAGASLYVHV